MEFFYESISRSELGPLDLEEHIIVNNVFFPMLMPQTDYILASSKQAKRQQKNPKQLEKSHILCREVKQNF